MKIKSPSRYDYKVSSVGWLCKWYDQADGGSWVPIFKLTKSQLADLETMEQTWLPAVDGEFKK